MNNGAGVYTGWLPANSPIANEYGLPLLTWWLEALRPVPITGLPSPWLCTHTNKASGAVWAEQTVRGVGVARGTGSCGAGIPLTLQPRVAVGTLTSSLCRQCAIVHTQERDVTAITSKSRWTRTLIIMPIMYLGAVATI